jgi:hypothetical protein
MAGHGGTTRLGPPSQQYEDACRGPRIILVDCTVDAAGRRHAGRLFTQHLQEVSAFLALVTGHSISASTWNQHSWTSKVVDGKIICDVRSIGYVETQIQSQMPVPGEHHAVPLHSVTRPDFSFSPNAMIGTTNELSLPADIIGLWDAYFLLRADQRRRFLQATAKWQEALMQPPDRRTFSFALMVVACEALKPPGREFHHHNINHVVEALLGPAFATRLKNKWFRAQYVRSVHLHLGEFLASEFGSLRPSRFHDPTFDSARRELARIAIIEWLRRGGQFSIPPVKRGKPPV